MDHFIILKLNDNRIIMVNGNSVTLANKDPRIKPNYFQCHQLQTGKLLFEPTIFDGFMFLDNNNNFYDTFQKKIFFNNGEIFVGDFDKQAFSLFDNYDTMENKIKQSINMINQTPNENNNLRNDIKNNMCNELIKELSNFNFKNILLKNGKYYYTDGNYHYIHDNMFEFFENNNKIYEADLLQEIKDNHIYLTTYGKTINYKNNYNGECFYNIYIGRCMVMDNIKFWIVGNNVENFLQELEKKDKSIIYKIYDERITLEQMYDKNFPVRIIVKDKNNKNIIYEINVKMSEQKQLYGNALIKDYRSGEILIVNINTNNIISNNILDDFPLFQDKNEYITFTNNIRPKKENIIKNEILKIDKIINDDN